MHALLVRPRESSALKVGLLALVLVLAAAACDDDPSGPADAVSACATDITSATDGSFVELCEVTSGPVRHVRIENFTATRTHASVQVVFGFDAPPAAPNDPIAADQFRVLFYGGGTPFPSPLVQATYGDVDIALDGDASFINAPSTICFDLYDGAAGEAPSFILWVDGQKGADCDDDATLTGASAYGARTYWNGTTGAITKDTNVYFRQASGTGATPTVTLFADAVLAETDIDAALACTTAWASNTDWQQLCAPAGIARHVRLESVQSSANNSYFYAVLGQAASPAGNPAQSAGKMILTGGRSNSGASWTWFRFDEAPPTPASTTQFTYETDAGQELYTEVTATICFDTGANDVGNARFVFWATGANGANCSDRSTLTLANALYDSTTDPSTAGIWDQPYIAGALNFVKTNTTNASMGNAVVMGEPAVL